MKDKLIVDEAYREFLASIDCSESTLSTYNRVLKLYGRYLGIKKLKYNQVKLMHVLEFKRGLLEKRLEANTINLYTSIIRRFYNYLNENGICSTKITGIKKETVKHGYKRLPLKVLEVQTLFEAINTDTEIGQRDYALIALMVNTGLRRGEVASLDTNDLFKLGAVVGVKVKRKGHATKDQHKVLSRDIYQLLINQAGDRKNAPLFITLVPGMERRRLSACQIANIVKTYFKRIGLTDKLYSTHSLRHTTAVTMCEQGKDIHEVMQYLGHNSIKTTQQYIQLLRESHSWSDGAANMLNDIFKKKDKKHEDNS